jgi:guanosine-3',5'-bis(diphosphate) 3'-pyrophosphohydrolase
LDESTADRTFQYVQDLSDKYTTENYPHLNRKNRRRQEAERLAKASPEAQTVKYADLIDNCLDIVRHDRNFGKVFVQESAQLLDLMTGGDSRLRQRALETVSASLKVLQAQ